MGTAAPPAGGASITLVTWFPTMPPGSLKGNVLETDDLDAAMDTLEEGGRAGVPGHLRV